MNLYLLEYNEKIIPDVGYDVFVSFVIRAPTPMKARKIAQAYCADAGAVATITGVWLDKAETRCHLIGTSEIVSEGIVLANFRPG